MSYLVQTKIFGRDVQFDVDFDNPFAFILRFICELRLKNLISKLNLDSEEDCKIFIQKSLEYLPKGFFIIYMFGDNPSEFVQFGRFSEELILDIPTGYPNFYKKNSPLIKKVLKKYKYKVIRFEKSLRVNFKKNYKGASLAAIDIAKEVLEIPQIKIVDFDFQKLISRSIKINFDHSKNQE
mgnify:CR=1 FL=1